MLLFDLFLSDQLVRPPPRLTTRLTDLDHFFAFASCFAISGRTGLSQVKSTRLVQFPTRSQPEPLPARRDRQCTGRPKIFIFK